MILSAKSGLRGMLVDLKTGQPIRKAIEANLVTGEYKAFRLDADGKILRGLDGRPLTYTGTTQLKFVPSVVLPKKEEAQAQPEELPHAQRPKLIQRRVRRRTIPLLDLRCEHRGCDRIANWFVADEIELPPVTKDGKRWKRGRVVKRRQYCDSHYKAPRLLHPGGDTLKTYEDGLGARPEWHST